MNIEQTLTDKEILYKELEDGYKANYNYYKKSQKEWVFIDTEMKVYFM